MVILIKKQLTSILAFSVIILSSCFLFSSPYANAVTPTISFSSTSANPGSTVTITGDNFNPSSALSISFDGTNFGPFTTADSAGHFSSPLTIPSAAPPGTYHIIVKDSSANTATATLTVIATPPPPPPPSPSSTPTISFSPTSANPGFTVLIFADNFTPSSSLSISFDGVNFAPLGSTDSLGNFKTPFIIPSTLTPGIYTVTITDLSKISATTSITINTSLPPTISLPKSIVLGYAIAGSMISITGNNFDSNSVLSISFDGVNFFPLLGSTDFSGHFYAAYTIPSTLTPGIFAITIKDTTGHSATTPITIRDPSLPLIINLKDQVSCEAAPLAGTWIGTNSTCTISGLTLRTGDSLTVDNSISSNIDLTVNGTETSNISGTIINNGLIINRGLINSLNDIITNFGTISNTGTINNYGIFTNNAGGTITEPNGGGINNNDVFTNYGNMIIIKGSISNNGGHLINTAGGTIIFHSGGFTNRYGGTVTNSGTIHFSSDSADTSFPSIYNAENSFFINSGIMIVNNSLIGTVAGIFTNPGTFSYCDSVILGTITGNQPVACAITLSPASGNPGSPVAITGIGFTPGVNVQAKFDNGNFSPLSNISDPLGHFTNQFTIPVGTLDGYHTVTITDANMLKTSAAFTINIPSPTNYVAIQSGNWDDPDTWQVGIVPIVIRSVDTVTINAGITVIIPTGYTVSSSGNIVNSGKIISGGSIINSGVISNSSGGVIENLLGSTLVNNSGAIINNYESIFVWSALVNSGTINNSRLLDNLGTVTNSVTGIIIDNSGSHLRIEKTGTLTNNGSIKNNQGSSIENYDSGNISDSEKGTVINNHFLVNSGTLSNIGAIITNNGVITNNVGGIINEYSNSVPDDPPERFTNNSVGTIVNNGVFNIQYGGGSINGVNNLGIITNTGTIFTSYSTLHNLSGGAINNLSSGIVQNYGDVANNLGATFNEYCNAQITQNPITNSGTLNNIPCLSVTITTTPSPAFVKIPVHTMTNPTGGFTPYSYSWSLTTPAGSVSALSSTTNQNPTFTPDISGNYQLGVTVTDVLGNMASTNAIVVATASTAGKASGEGKLGSNIHFDFNVQSKDGKTFQGNLGYDDKSKKINGDGRKITLFIWGKNTHAAITGQFTPDDHSNTISTFLVQVTDIDVAGVNDDDQKSTHDTFSITIMDSTGAITYQNSGTVQGHIEIKGLEQEHDIGEFSDGENAHDRDHPGNHK